MRRIVIAIAWTGCALMLSACGLADSRSPLPIPDFLRVKSASAPALEAEPDARGMVRDKLDSVFTVQANPQHVQVSEARHELRGLGWNACVKAELTSASGKPLGLETYRIVIENGVISDRRRALPEDGCDLQTYQPI
jgi:hypothetical protein